MRQFICARIAPMAILVVLSAQAQTAPKTSPSQAQLQQMVQAKAYRPALQAIAQILPAVKTGVTTDYDRYTLLMLRGECLVQLKDPATAIIAFEQAVSAAASRQQDEAARAVLTLLKKSPRAIYTPRTGDRTPLDLTDLDSRKRAMVALFSDELPAISTRVTEALKAKSLPPILAIGPTLRDLHALEEAGSGGDTQSAALVRPLADRIHELIEAELNRLDEQAKAIERASSHTIDYGGGSFQTVEGALRWVPAQGTTGLSGDNRQALRENIAYLGKIEDVCGDMAAVARRYDRDGQRWTALAKRTRSLLDFATAVYDHE